MTRARLPVLVLVAAALLAAVLVDRDIAADDIEVAGLDVVPVVGPADDLGSTWYCAAGSAGDIPEPPPPDTADEEGEGPAEGGDEDGDAAPGDDQAEDADGDGEEDDVPAGPVEADHTVIVSNLTESDRTVVVTIHPGTEEPVDVDLEVAALTSEVIALGDHVDAAAAAALVEADGGGIAVAHRLEGPTGADTGPCASASSNEWHFAWGDTSRDARSIVALFNPFPGDAVVDFRFVTSDGVREPQDLTGVVVPGGSVVLADVGEHVRRREQVSTTATARSGRVVAERLQTFDGSVDREGLAVDLGTPTPREAWVHPYARFSDDLSQTLVVFNAGDGPAEVDVEVSLPADVVGGVEPFELSIAPFDYAVVPLSEEDRLLDVFGETGGEYTLTVRSLNGAPVVSDLVTVGDGVAASSGTAVTATEQVLVGAALDDPDLGLRLVNLDPETDVTGAVEIVADGDVELAEEVELDGGDRVVVDLTDDDIGEGTIVVRTSSPVVAELISVWDEPEGRSNRVPVPLAGRLEPLPALAER